MAAESVGGTVQREGQGSNPRGLAMDCVMSMEGSSGDFNNML